MAKKNGSVRSYRKTAGRVRGPIQVSWAESVSPIIISKDDITRCCATNKEDEDKERTRGSMYRVPYALYRYHVYVSPSDAAKTGFDANDLARLENSLISQCEMDRSTSRGEMTVRHIVKFSHESVYGNAPSWKLFKRISVKPNTGVTIPKDFDDYTINLDFKNLPENVTMEEIDVEKSVQGNGTNPQEHRVEYVVLIDVKNGNPNGNPNDGRPRQDAGSAKGLISPVCIKRKIRNFMQVRYAEDAGMEIFFQEGHLLNDLISAPYEDDAEVKAAFEAKKKGDKSANPEALAQKHLCKKYYDIRTFGAVLSTGDKEKETVEIAEDVED